MKNFSSKAITFFIVFVMIFNQFQPVAALQNNASAPTTPAAEAPHPAQKEMAGKPAKPLEYNLPAAPKPVKPSIKLSATPKFVTGSGRVMINWTIKGALPRDHALTLLVTLADGYWPDTNIVRIYEGGSHILSLPVSVGDLSQTQGQGVVASGQFALYVQNPLDNIDFPARLVDGKQVLADFSLSLPKHEKFSVKKNKGTAEPVSISARKGKVKIHFGAKALTEDTNVEFGAPAGDSAPAESLSGQPFEIDAQGVQSKQELHQFADDIAIDVDYSTLDLQGKDENNLFVYWYDPTTEDWYALPTLVDTVTKTLHATTTHFSVFDTGINDYTASHLPTVDAFQVSSFTGAGTYSMPIEVPAGPGGLQPGINLSYNSQVVDQSTAQTQASWVGMGWSLDMNSIELNDNGTNAINTPDTGWGQDDTWSINVNGISSTIVKAGKKYVSADGNFMKFEYIPAGADGYLAADQDTWKVWDNNGNIYSFKNRVKTIYVDTYNQNTSSRCRYELLTYQWYLTSMSNVFGRELIYTYVNDTKNIAVPHWTGSHASGGHGCRTEVTDDNPAKNLVTATYPETITYPGAHYRVRFELSDEEHPRLDYGSAWPEDAAYRNFQRRRLQNIFVEQDVDGDHSFAKTIRKYHFDYASDTPSDWTETTGPIWPGIRWTHGGYTTTLLKVRQYGVDGTHELRTASFTYGDNMHLTDADNGEGGSVHFTYQAWQDPDHARASQTYKYDFINQSGTICNLENSFWTGHIECVSDPHLHIELRGRAHSTPMLDNPQIKNNALRPGGFYKFNFIAVDNPYNLPLQYTIQGKDDEPSFQSGGVVALDASAWHATVYLNADGADDHGGDHYISMHSMNVQLLPSIYRVTARAVSDGQGHTDTYTYDYGTASVNDNVTSAAAHACSDTILASTHPTCQLYHEKYSEFRGHNRVTEIDPNGRKTVTFFYQDDILKGRPSSVRV